MKEHIWQHAASQSMGGKEDKPKKELSHIETKKAKNGGYIHTHHHTRPDHHPAEEHISADDAAMQAHMMASMGDGAPPSGDPTDGASAGAPDPAAPAAAAAPAAGA